MTGSRPTARLTVVAPVYNEAEVVAELVERISRSCGGLADALEILIVDDGSQDATPQILADLATREPALRPLRPAHNLGQLGATLHGLAASQGDVVVVLDGDLQDPPEHIGELVRRLTAGPRLDVVFAVKSARRDGLAMRLGAGAYHQLITHLGSSAVPAGAGSYCALRGDLARRVARVRLRQANLAPLVGCLAGQVDCIAYAKAARYDETSRVGWLGLVREALGSLALTPALPRLLLMAAAAGASVALLSGPLFGPLPAAAALGLALAAGAVDLRRRYVLAPALR